MGHEIIILEIQNLAKKDEAFKNKLLQDPVEVFKEYKIFIRDKNLVKIEKNPYGGVFLAFDKTCFSEDLPMIQVKTSSSSAQENFMDCLHY